MDTQRLRLHLEVALKTPSISKACAALERLRSSLDLLDHLPEPALEIVREHVRHICGAKEGAQGAFARAYLSIVEETMEEARERRREFTLWGPPSESPIAVATDRPVEITKPSKRRRK